MKRVLSFLLALCCAAGLQAAEPAHGKSLRERQQDFVNLKFGMFIHFNIPTFANQDWCDPDADASIFNPVHLDCAQWAEAAKAAKMRFGCLTAKHHSGFCIWDTASTDYNVMNSPAKRDIVREYVDAFRAAGLKTMLYYSILDTHHRLRPGHITSRHIDMIRTQLTELLTRYGEIDALIIDGWDAPWSRISYETIPFGEIYALVKSLQPDCLVMDLNAAKYPREALFYTDIKSYEQNAGQRISTDTNRLPALSCLPINDNWWFWKDYFPAQEVKSPEWIVEENIVPCNKAYCTYILNVAPNTDGLIDDNAVEALRRIGELWDDTAAVPALPRYDAPITAENIAKHRPAESSWSYDMCISDFGNDDDFSTAWVANEALPDAWYEVRLDSRRPFNAVSISCGVDNMPAYRLVYFDAGKWHELDVEPKDGAVKIHRFERVKGERVKVVFDNFDVAPAITELGVYNEMR